MQHSLARQIQISCRRLPASSIYQSFCYPPIELLLLLFAATVCKESLCAVSVSITLTQYVWQPSSPAIPEPHCFREKAKFPGPRSAGKDSGTCHVVQCPPSGKVIELMLDVTTTGMWRGALTDEGSCHRPRNWGQYISYHELMVFP